LSRLLRQAWLFLRLSRPLFLLGGLLLYGLGAAIALYLLHPIDVGLYLLGQGLVTLLQLMTHYQNEYFDAPLDLGNLNRTPWSGGSGVLGPDGLPRRTALYAGVACLTGAATLASILLVRGGVPLLSWLLLLLVFLGAFFYSAPPVRLVTSGYGELSTSLLVSGLLPAFAFSLQTGELHRLLWLSTLPLIALHFAMLMAFELADFGADTRTGKRTLMVRLGWSSGMRLHDLSILLAVVALVSGFFSGLPARVALGSLIALPLGMAQIWQMARIRAGYPPHWRTLTFSALGLFALAAYLQLAGYLLSR
jgi:1,4-dihydroxy-2-naphthoate octaprenyltransferase